MPAHGLAALGVSEKLVAPASNSLVVTNGMISASVVGQHSDANRSGDFLTNVGSTTGLKVVTYSTSTDINMGAPLLFQANSDQTLTDARSVWALKDNGHTIDLATTSLSVSSGGLILNGGTIQNGTLQLGAEGLVYTSLAGGTISAKTNFITNGLAKFGPGTLTLEGNANPIGGVALNSGSIDLKTNNAQASFRMMLGTTLTGTGRTTGFLAGGLISPGDHVGILTAGSVASSQMVGTGETQVATHFAFEFNQVGLPNFAAATASGNDVLRLTSSAGGFIDTLTAGNEVDLYFNVPFGLQAGQTYYGGFFEDSGGAFDSSIAGANYQIFVSDPLGTTTFEGHTYSSYAGGVGISTVAQTADFGGGPVNGYVMQVQVVPEPTSWTLLVSGAALGGLFRRSRRKARNLRG